MTDISEYLRVYNLYERMFHEDVLVGLPEDKDVDELYDIMVACLNAGKDAVEMGYSEGYAGMLKDGDGVEHYT